MITPQQILQPSAGRIFDFDEVWHAEFGPALAESRRRIAERRTDAMLDVTLTLCGEPVRQMTGRDLITLDAIGNAFIAGASGSAVDFFEVAGFIWQLHTSNTQTSTIANLWRRHRFLKRLAKRDTQADAMEIVAFIDRMLMDPDGASAPNVSKAPTDALSALQREPKTHFFIPLLMSVVDGARCVYDPVSGRPLCDIPLPRLIMFSRFLREREGGEKTYTELHSLQNRCMDRMNQLNGHGRRLAQEAAA